ncbi:MAG: UDP-N-acetylmuramoyl-tripeptide--D-alanyl-D-alanine ligase, partial [Clostridia bacterium]|nr:UDP-N-acetylmuramoyl-tripeptide--D-alanyl-D-alanine ligase [Clostridia bacterium]
AKKPLVFTPRVRRLLILSFILSAALCATAYFVGNIFFSIFIPLVILFAPYLLVIWGSVAAPFEKALSDGFVKDARRILKESPSLKVIGVTGSYGKTSTKYFLKELLSVKYRVFMTPGNYNTTLGVTRAVREGLKPYHEIFICEMGARHLGDVREICELVFPETGVITSVGPQHLETFGSLDNVLRGKLELFDAVKERGAAIINADSAPLRKALPSLTGNEIITCGEGGDIEAVNIKTTADGTSFDLKTPDGETVSFETRLLGKANVQDLTLAIACAARYGIASRELTPAVRALKSVPHRLELTRRPGLSIIDDAYNSNPEGARVALDTLSSFEGVRILITPGLIELGAEEDRQNELLGEYAAARCDYALLVGATNSERIKRGLLRASFPEEKIRVLKDFSEAYSAACGMRGDPKLALLLNDLPDNYS